MIETYQYHNNNYKIIECVNMGNLFFVIGENEKKQFSYMKLTQLATKSVFTSLDNLIAVLNDYRNQKIYNLKSILEYFILRINKLVKKGRLKDYEVNDIFIKLGKLVNDNKLYNLDVIARKELKKIDNLIDKYQSKPLLLKLCNMYGLLLLVSIIGIGYFANSFINWYSDGKDIKKMSSNIVSETKTEQTEGFSKEELATILENEKDDMNTYSYNYWAYSNVTMLSVDFTDLLNQNDDTVAWLYVNNTTIDYPVVQSGDNSFYLNHTFDKSYNAVGWLFADYRSNLKELEKNTVIYGHGRLDNVMFGSLHRVLDSSWYNDPENQIIKISTPDKNMLWQVVSIYTIPSESYYLTHTFENDESYQKFLDTILERSMNDFNVSLNTNDYILTLSTCLDNSGNRIVVHAKLVKVEER